MDESAEADDDQLPKSALAWQLPERHQMPRPIGRRRFPAQDVEIAVIRAYLVKGILRAVPLVEGHAFSTCDPGCAYRRSIV